MYKLYICEITLFYVFEHRIASGVCNIGRSFAKQFELLDIAFKYDMYKIYGCIYWKRNRDESVLTNRLDFEIGGREIDFEQIDKTRTLHL